MKILIILFLLSKTKYDPVVILSEKDNLEVSKLLSKGLEKSGFWNK